MWDQQKRRAIADMYRANGQDVPRHLLPDLETNPWRRYELEKELKDWETFKAVNGVKT